MIEYRDAEGKSILYHAIEKQNFLLVKSIYKKFPTDTYYEMTKVGTTPLVLAKKDRNFDLRKMITRYVESKEIEEYIESEHAKDPSIPRNLLILKRKLKIGIEKQ